MADFAVYVFTFLILVILSSFFVAISCTYIYQMYLGKSNNLYANFVCKLLAM